MYRDSIFILFPVLFKLQSASIANLIGWALFGKTTGATKRLLNMNITLFSEYHCNFVLGRYTYLNGETVNI